MAIKRFISNKDNTISNLFLSNLTERGTSGNTGMSDILEIFSIHAQASSSSLEKSRVLIDFPISEIQASRSSDLIPASGSVDFILNFYNAPHGQSTPENIYIDVNPLLVPWDEGFGLDMESYTDKGKSNWIYASTSAAWVSPGGDIPDYNNISGDLTPATQELTSSTEDISLNVTKIVEEWLKSSKVAATARLAFSDVPTENTKVTLISYDGTSKTYKFTDGLDPDNLKTGLIDVSDNTVLVDRNGGVLATVVSRLQTAITGANGHSNKITVNNAANFDLTQSITGIYGNTLISIATPEGEDARVTVRKTLDNSATTHFEGGQGAQNCGMMLKLSGSYEDGTLNRSFYTKKFFARGSQYFFKRPSLEARWESAKKDNTANLVTASPVRTQTENVQTMYYYNYVNGQLADLPAAPEFTLTADKSLTQKVTIKPESTHNSIDDPVELDYTKNAFIDFKVNNTSLFDNNAYYQSMVKVTFSDGDIETSYYFLGRHSYSSSVHGPYRNSIYPVDSTNTPSNRASAALGLVADMNTLPGFSDLFFAEVSPIASLNGEGVRIYSKIAGSIARNSKLAIYRFSNTAATGAFLSFVSNSGNPDFDTAVNDGKDAQNNPDNSPTDAELTRSQADWATYASNINSSVFAAGYVPTNPFTAAETSTERSRTFAYDTGGSAEDISSSRVSTGTYRVDFKIANNIATETLYQKWWVTSGNLDEVTGLIKGHGGNSPVSIKQYYASSASASDDYIVKILNLKQSYSPKEEARMQVYVRSKTEDKNIYTKMVSKAQPFILQSAFYQIRRTSDNLIVIPYSTGSLNFSGLGYDDISNYFSLDMSLLEPNYAYEISFLQKRNNDYVELRDKFKFRVD